MHGRFPDGELVILGLGRFGGHALTHASDLDLIYLLHADGAMSDGPKPLGPNDYFNRLANRVTAALSVPTAAGPLYEVDTRLRPEGATGMLIVSLDAFEDISARRLDMGAYGAVPRAAGVWLGRGSEKRAAAIIGEILRAATGPGDGRCGCRENARGDGTPQAADKARST